MPEVKPVERPRDEVEDLAFLGREFLTWLVWRVERDGGVFGAGEEAFTVTFGQRARLGAGSGDVIDAVLRGLPAAHSAMAKVGLGAGCTVREAELRIVRNEREWRFTLEAETLDLRSVKLPVLLSEEYDEQFAERLAMLQELDFMVQTAFGEFVKLRTRPAWARTTVPAIRGWLLDGMRLDPAAPG